MERIEFRTIDSGRQGAPAPTRYTDEERADLQAAGKDPALMNRVRGAANFGDYMRRKGGGGLELVDTPERAAAQEVGDWLATIARFQSRKARGLVPPGEIEEAMLGGINAWRRLVRKYGPVESSLPDPQIGGGAA